MKKHVMKKWVAALRSGEYKQGMGQLEMARKYCCLGVLCKIAPKSVPKVYQNKKGTKLWGTTLFGQKKVREWSGIKSADGEFTEEGVLVSLIQKNDGFVGVAPKSFKKIANIIEKNWEKL